MVPVVHLIFLFMSMQLIYSGGCAFDLYGCHGTIGSMRQMQMLCNFSHFLPSSSHWICSNNFGGNMVTNFRIAAIWLEH